MIRPRPACGCAITTSIAFGPAPVQISFPSSDSTITLPGNPLPRVMLIVSAAPSIVADIAARLSAFFSSGISVLITKPSRLTIAHASMVPTSFKPTIISCNNSDDVSIFTSYINCFMWKIHGILYYYIIFKPVNKIYIHPLVYNCFDF